MLRSVSIVGSTAIDDADAARRNPATTTRVALLFMRLRSYVWPSTDLAPLYPPLGTLLFRQIAEVSESYKGSSIDVRKVLED
jgi:hypothetical protein